MTSGSTRKKFVLPSLQDVDAVRNEYVTASEIYKKHANAPNITATPSSNIPPVNVPYNPPHVAQVPLPVTNQTYKATTNVPPTTHNPQLQVSDKQIHVHHAPGSSRSILVSNCQKGNRVLKYIKNSPWEYANIVPDYLLSSNTCALFLSVKFHLLHPENLAKRANDLGHQFSCRVLLCLVDVDDSAAPLCDICRICLACRLTLVLAWSNEEAARYIETYKAYEHKSADIIKQRVSDEYIAQLADCLTQIGAVNKTDVLTLASTFGSVQSIASSSVEELLLCPGLGEKKVKHIYNAFHQSFKNKPS